MNCNTGTSGAVVMRCESDMNEMGTYSINLSNYINEMIFVITLI
jgi:hypothetical protein